MRSKRTALAVLAAVALAGCSSSGAGTSSSDDIVGQQACDDYRTLQQNITDGTVTPDEVRSKLKSINKDAQYAKTPGVVSGVRDALAGVTQGTDVAAAAKTLDTACTSIGH